MEKILFILFFLLPFSLHAQIVHAPHSFNFKEGRAIFVDFKDAIYRLTYDPSNGNARSITSITFEADEEGMPIYDLVQDPSRIVLDGKNVTDKLINSPDGDTAFRVVLQKILPGRHTLEIFSSITKNLSFYDGGVSSGFWFSDFEDRSFLEAYLPTNLEFDQYKMTFNIDFMNLKNQRIYSNGKVTKLSDSKFNIEFPSTYSSSSIYFHTDQIGKNLEMSFNFHSRNGGNIPVTIYSPNQKEDLELLKDKVIQMLNELEKKYGHFLHSTLTILDGGENIQAMEYCGALVFDKWTLKHELTHSYFARGGFIPANGNAGWIDEAIVKWNDLGSPTLDNLGGQTTNMAGHSEYRRYTDELANTQGAAFMSYLHYKFQNKGGLTPFLNFLTQKSAWKPMTTEEFILTMSDFYSEDLTALFKKYVYSPENTSQIGKGRLKKTSSLK